MVLVKVFLIFFVISLTFGSALRAELIDKVAAVVNDEVITLSEVREVARLLKNDKNAKGLSERELELLALEKLIEEKLVEYEAKRYDVSVSDEEVEAFVEELTKDLGGKERLLEFLRARGLTYEEYERQVREELKKLKLIQIVTKNRVVVPEEEVRAYYERHYPKEKVFYLAAIITKDKEKIFEAKKELERGVSFEEVGKKYSVVPESWKLLGRFRLKELNEAIRREVSHATQGSVIGPVKVGNHWEILKVIRVEEDRIPYELVKKKIKRILYEKKLDEYFRNWIKELKEKAYIKVYL